MKKIFAISLVIIFSLAQLAPAVAMSTNPSIELIGGDKKKKKEKKEESADACCKKMEKACCKDMEKADCSKKSDNKKDEEKK